MKTLQARFTRSQLRLMFSGWKTSLDVKGSFDTCSHVMLKAVGQALFSSGLQNPKFTAEEKKGEDYEIRTYHATKWVSTSLSGMQLDAAMNTGFRRLFRYIQGNNQNKEHQASPPEPSDPEVFVENRKEFTAYIRTYGGFSNENMKREELLKLLESLQRDVVPYVDKPFYTVGYDSPFKLTNRRNEVWVLKKEHEQ
ncbi:heme-binding protein 2 isoform X2 [Seriola aureovittata]|uniref:heme-binding protein 2 isoform X2 n=1 Tax=Seriola aureovittata TaxID=2871759 RepID=UPI0024BE9786|nr:heme-binding protein 2 isoform X2 [Seriola aureovittata]